MVDQAPVLSSAQIASFHAEGYLVDQVLFATAEIEALGAAYSLYLQNL